jgi:hypothetical protein
MAIHAAHFGLNHLCWDNGVRQITLERYMSAVSLARQVGAKLVVFHSLYNPLIAGPDSSRWVARSLGFWERLLPLAEEMVACFVIENCWEDRPDHIVALLEAAGSRRLKACLDVGHVNAWSSLSPAAGVPHESEGGSLLTRSPRLYGDLAWVWPFLSPPEDYVEEVESFRRRFSLHGVPDGARVLHLGSGGGSIDFHLKRHYRVTGMDISPEMLARAGRVNPEVEYVLGDIRTARLGRTFDAVLLHDASAYMTTLEQLFQAYETAAAHLERGGVMVTPPEELRSRFVQHRSSVQDRTVGDRTVTTIELDYDPDRSDSCFEKAFIFAIREGHVLSVEWDVHHMGLYDLSEMIAAMERAGFRPRVSRWELSDLPPDVEYPLVTAVKLR